MKSGKQRRTEIMEKRRARIPVKESFDVYSLPVPVGAVLTDRDALARNNNTYGLLPLFYVDYAFNCRDCGCAQIWTGKQQKWWYEIMQGNINSVAIRCRPCRKAEQQRKKLAREAHLNGLAAKHKQ
ncbi:zinc-ribbon domain containing protein [Undibacterium sp. TS12]|uniref:zinc-ribbon domain containing protein n=1 Tax=Undibacterium sp. TS12 TaxID=2908202 RepID=UPI001F4CD7DD|nr:zinc-ribbon domain containing protein [Undibacterium sp. TS12]MCH8620228.1 zinc-ribbon domain-containing protein [Undibacterium sp. TS12]